ncbi:MULTISPECIES: hypothetical protein [unclassified Nocardioides]|uniref:hypothetical protein n=1 Tax=unclassified Nocardioides TaxID=2615069 RepID=UPI0006FA167A|nr:MULTISPECIES: hypothetical protein [unclassified Nocardioides]KRA29401.1 hypothetical protein ASD81_20640 [Nocardioides sp. Root614]KRA85593.1 hypothetical protein ASD84_24400 [Nocardioides sp. Root682]
MDNDNAPDQPAATPDPAPVPDPAPSVAAAAPTQPLDPAPPTKVRWRDRAFQFRAVLAVALASVILGAGAGVLGTLVFDHDQDRAGRHHRIEGPGERGDFPGRRGPGRDGPNMPQPDTDLLPPGTVPQQDEGEPSSQDNPTSSS